MHLEIHDTIASGDHVVLHFTNSGTNVGIVAQAATCARLLLLALVGTEEKTAAALAAAAVVRVGLGR